MSAQQTSFRVLSLLTEDTVQAGSDSPEWIPLRRRLGIQAFGTNAFRATRAGDPLVEDHVESPGQEELYLVVAGRVRFTVDGHEVDLAAGEVVFVPDPELRRAGVALEDDSIVIAIGGWPGHAYHSLPWEPIYLARERMRKGDWAGAADVLSVKRANTSTGQSCDTDWHVATLKRVLTTVHSRSCASRSISTQRCVSGPRPDQELLEPGRAPVLRRPAQAVPPLHGDGEPCAPGSDRRAVAGRPGAPRSCPVALVE